MNRTRPVPKPSAEPPEMTPARAMELAREILARSGGHTGPRIVIDDSEEGRRRRAAAIRAIADIPDTDPPGAYDQALRNLDEGRPERPLFRDME